MQQIKVDDKRRRPPVMADQIRHQDFENIGIQGGLAGSHRYYGFKKHMASDGATIMRTMTTTMENA
jgi:hypothetical protein